MEPAKMEPASTIRELPNRLLPNYPLMQGRDDQFYVPIYQDEIDKLRDSILYDEIFHQTLFISGQTGTGKTTALHFLPDAEITAQYNVVFLDAKNLFDLSDVTIIEILIMICYRLMDNDSSKTLENEFFDEITRLEKVERGFLEQVTEKSREVRGEMGAKVEAEIGGNPIARLVSLFKLKGNFFANLQMDGSYREVTREAFNFNKLELQNITNRIIDRYLDLLPGNKKLLIILNDLDHLKDPQLIQNIFVRNRQFLKALNCKKVISVPVSLIAEEEFMEEISYFCIKLLPNPIMVNHGDGDLITRNTQILRQLVARRLQNTDLIDPEAIEEAIKYSGGILRQFISILHEAAKHARRNKGEQLHDSNIEEGKRIFRQILERSAVMSTEKIHILEDVRVRNQTEASGTQAFNECLLGNQILVYMNHPTWYQVNPLIEETVELYAKRSSTG